MKITFILPRDNMSGGLRVIGIYARELLARGHEVRLVAQPWPKRGLIGTTRSLLRTGKPPRRPPSQSYIDDLAGITTVLDRPRAVLASDLPDADVVVATFWKTASAVAALPPSKGAKAYFMQDYGGPGQELEKVEPTWQLPFTFLTLTSALSDQIRAHNPKAEIALVPNAVDLEKFAVGPRMRPEQPTFGFAYRPSPTKGADIAIAALQQARHAAKLKILSFGHEPEKKLTISGEFDYRVRPDDSEVRDIYAACTAWLFPSRMEGFGLPIFEAMASRTPVIGSRAGAAPDVIVSGQNGHLVDIGNAAGMAAAIDRMVEMSAEEWHAMSEAAYATVAGLNWSDATDRFEAALIGAAARQVDHKQAVSAR